LLEKAGHFYLGNMSIYRRQRQSYEKKILCNVCH